ncbi:hypothetical protein X739_05580 [Mesorhizobium sp. LNHC220B00]|nr:hypothetical protein X739_05580 [Mesorhizobium sp. LNHC220B00]ESZ01073.1 hypothetical protein X738_05035 [Mesorhizobium sp. LNHC209A00]
MAQDLHRNMLFRHCSSNFRFKPGPGTLMVLAAFAMHLWRWVDSI